MSKRIISRLWLRSIFLFVVLLAILPLAMFMGCSSGGGENPVQEEAPVFGDSSHSDGYDCLASEYYKTYDELIQCVPCDNRSLGGMNQNIPFGQETPIGDVKYRCVQSLVDGSYSWKRSDSISFLEYDWGFWSQWSRDSVRVAKNLQNLKHGTMTDSRDGQVYKTVTIGTQTWMAENLNYRYLGPTEWLDSSSFCYDNELNNCAKYGRLYLWSGVVDSAGFIDGNVANGCGNGAECVLGEIVRGVCPEGWHLPQNDEWRTLIDAFTVHGRYYEAYTKLMSASGWDRSENGDDSSSFSAIPAGYKCKKSEYEGEGSSARFWSYENGTEFGMKLDNYYKGVQEAKEYNCDYIGYSVRCVKDEYANPLNVSSSSRITSSSSEAYGVMTDRRDGKKYKTVTIGSQTWMAENLNFNYYWGEGLANFHYSSFCYNNDPANCEKYGRLYIWSAAMDSAGAISGNTVGCGYGSECSPRGTVRGICPTWWHLPSKAEWEELIVTVDGSIMEYGPNKAGIMLKSASGWSFNRNGIDAYSFSALPAGLGTSLVAEVAEGKNFSGEGRSATFWSSTEDGRQNAKSVWLYTNYDSIAEITNSSKYLAYSVRCVKD